MSDLLLALGFWAGLFILFDVWRAREVRQRNAESLRPENQLKAARERVTRCERQVSEAVDMGWKDEQARRQADLDRARDALAALEAEFPEAAARAQAEN